MSSKNIETDASLDYKAPLIQGNPTFASITESVSKVVESKTSKEWALLFGFFSSLMMVMVGLGVGQSLAGQGF